MNASPQFGLPGDLRPIGRVEAAPEGGGEGSFDLQQQLSVLRRRWRIILPIAIVVAALVFANSFFETPRYAATALVLLDARTERVVDAEQVLSGISPEAGVIESEVEVLRSRVLLGRVVDVLDLKANPVWNPALREPSALDQARALLDAPRALLRGLRPQAPSAPAPASPVAETDPTREALIDVLAGSLRVQRRRLSYVMEVTVTSIDPRQSALVANAVTDAYLESQLEARFDAAQRANAWLGERLATLRDEVQAKERAAANYRAQSGLVTVEGGSLAEQQASDLQGQIIAARADLAEKEARYAQVQELVGRGGSIDAIASVMNSATISALRREEAEVARRQTDLEARYGELHPEVQNIRLERADIRAQIEGEIRRIVTNLSNEVEVTRTRVRSLEDNAGRVRSQLATNNQALVRLRELERDAAATRAVYENFLARFQEISNAESLPVSEARVVSNAVPSNVPSSPNLSRALLMAMFLGLAIGVGVAYLLEILDDGLNSSDEVERKLNAPLLTTIPAVGKAELAKLSPDRRDPPSYLVEKPISAYAESLRVLRATLTYVDLDHRPQVVAITSAMPGEGKTTIAMSLARAAASSGQRVLIVDCDLRRHSLGRYLEAPPEVGVLQVLAGEADWRSVILRDPETGAEILPATSASFTPRDVFGSDAMGRLLDEARGAYDLVILDCAPALAVAETRALARRADVTVVVVRWGATPARAARSAMRQLADAGATIAGVVLNNVDSRGASGGYYDAPYYSKRYAGYYSS